MTSKNYSFNICIYKALLKVSNSYALFKKYKKIKILKKKQLQLANKIYQEIFYRFAKEKNK